MTYNNCGEYGIGWGDIFHKIGIYIFGKVYIDFRDQRALCKLLKGGYIVVRGDKKRELVRGDLRVGFLKIDHGDMVYTGIDATAKRIEFWSKDRVLIYWTDL